MSIIDDWASIESDSMAEYELYNSAQYEDEVDDWGYIPEEDGDGYTTPEYDPDIVGEYDYDYGTDTYDVDYGSDELTQEQIDAVNEDLELLMMPEEGEEDLYAFRVSEEDEEDEDSWWASLLGNKDLMNLLLAGGMGALDAFGKTKAAIPTRSSGGGGGGGSAPTTALAGQSGVVTRR